MNNALRILLYLFVFNLIIILIGLWISRRINQSSQIRGSSHRNSNNEARRTEEPYPARSQYERREDILSRAFRGKQYSFCRLKGYYKQMTNLNLFVLPIRHKMRGFEDPGGRVDKDELNKDAARRQLLEETGIQVDELHLGEVRSNIRSKRAYRTSDHMGRPIKETKQARHTIYVNPESSPIDFEHKFKNLNMDNKVRTTYELHNLRDSSDLFVRHLVDTITGPKVLSPDGLSIVFDQKLNQDKIFA